MDEADCCCQFGWTSRWRAYVDALGSARSTWIVLVLCEESRDERILAIKSIAGVDRRLRRQTFHAFIGALEIGLRLTV